MYFYASGIEYDTDGQEVELASNLFIEADDIDEVVDKISDKTGWLVKSVGAIRPFSKYNPQQVHLEISTDLGFTADFLRQLANEIEYGAEPEDFELFYGVAHISWPDSE